MEPGKELDALIAEKVMGLEPWPGEPGAFRAPFVPPGYMPKPCLPPDYSTDIGAAWKVVEKLISKDKPHFQTGLCDTFSNCPKWFAEFDLDRPFKRVMEKGDTAPHAICLAALKTLESENCL